MTEQLCKKLIEHKMTIAAAESCTGGTISAKLVSCAGISEVFLAGITAYSNQAKIDLLGVDTAIIEQYGAVSEPCAKAMAEGVCKVTGARCGLATTGIAGPGGATTTKPVGLVYIAVCLDGKTDVLKLLLKGGRTQIMEEASNRVLVLLNEKIMALFER